MLKNEPLAAMPSVYSPTMSPLSSFYTTIPARKNKQTNIAFGSVVHVCLVPAFLVSAIQPTPLFLSHHTRTRTHIILISINK